MDMNLGINFDRLVGKNVLNVVKLDGGINNPTFKLLCEDRCQYIVQFPGEKYPDKVKRQPFIVDLLKDKTNFLIANIVKTDCSHDIIDKDYIVLEFLSGELLNKLSDSFTDKEIANLYKDIALYLSSLHSVEFDSFGLIKFDKGGPYISPKYSSARDLIFEKYLSYINKAINTPFEHYMSDLKKWLKYNVSIFGSDIVPCLTHNDFSDTNILVTSDGHISGILDLDNISVGNNVTDIYRVYSFFSGARKEFALKIFFENYTVKLPENFDKQIKFYELAHVLAFVDCWNQIVEAYNKEDLENMIQKMNKNIKILLSTSL